MSLILSPLIFRPLPSELWGWLGLAVPWEHRVMWVLILPTGQALPSGYLGHTRNVLIPGEEIQLVVVPRT